MQPNQQVDFLSDGGEDVRNVQLYLNPQAEHLLDWFHLTMRLTVLNQTAKGLPESVGEGEDQYGLRTCVIKDLERIKWYLWHGNVFQALNELQSLEMDLDAAAFESKNENSQKLLKGVEELHTYVERNQEFVPNYGERYRNGERIASGFVESAINQVVSKRMVKKQQMGWSQRGAHLLLQIRTRVLDEEWENTFRRWHPDFRPRALGENKWNAARGQSRNPQTFGASADDYILLKIHTLPSTRIRLAIQNTQMSFNEASWSSASLNACSNKSSSFSNARCARRTYTALSVSEAVLSNSATRARLRSDFTANHSPINT